MHDFAHVGRARIARHWHVVDLGEEHRGLLHAHFLALGRDDRRLRFGITLNDSSIAAYVDSMDFDHDTLLGVHGAGGALAGVAHLGRAGADAELGLSVLPALRQRGIGARLFDRAAEHARAVRVRRLYMHCLAENGAIMRLARASGMRVQLAQGEADAWIELHGAPYDRHVKNAPSFRT